MKLKVIRYEGKGFPSGGKMSEKKVFKAGHRKEARNLPSLFLCFIYLISLLIIIISSFVSLKEHHVIQQVIQVSWFQVSLSGAGAEKGITESLPDPMTLSLSFILLIFLLFSTLHHLNLQTYYLSLSYSELSYSSLSFFLSNIFTSLLHLTW